jgi:hypothetical protein
VGRTIAPRIGGQLSLDAQQELAAVALQHFHDSVSVAVAAGRHEDLAGLERNIQKLLALTERSLCDRFAQKAADHRPSQTTRHSEREDAEAHRVWWRLGQLSPGSTCCPCAA